MLDKDFELLLEIKQIHNQMETEFFKLNNAYLAGNPEATLLNLGLNISHLTPEQVNEAYINIIQRLAELNDQLTKTVDN